MNDRRLRVLLSYAVSDDPHSLAQQLSNSGYEVVSPNHRQGAMPAGRALLDLVRSVDAVVAWLDSRHPNVLLEVGAALGAGKPIVVVTGRGIPPVRDLADLPVVNSGAAVDAFDETIRRAVGEPSRREIEWPQSLGPALRPDRAESFLGEDAIQSGGYEFAKLVGRLFEAAGCQVVQPAPDPSSPIRRPDLVIWHDELLAGFGLPVPVEAILGPANPAAIVPRLQRTLDFSGAQSLLAVSWRDAEPMYWSGEDGRLVLVVAFHGLVRALTSLPLAKALGAMRAEAALVGTHA